MMHRRNILGIAAVAVLVALSGLQGASAEASSSHYANCTVMHRHHAHGVGKTSAHDHVSGKSKPVTNFYRNNALYAANRSLDRDKDGIACESH